MEKIFQSVAPQGALTDEQRQEILEQLIARKVLAQKAKRHGILKSKEFAEEMESVREQIAGGLLTQNFERNHPLSEAAIAAEMAQLQTEAPQPRLYAVRWMTFSDKERALTVLEKLRAGSLFGTLAREMSEEEESKPRGGLQDGWRAAEFLPPGFGEVIKTLQPGDLFPTPMPLEDKWAVVRVEEFMDQPEDVQSLRGRATQSLQRKQTEAYVATLRKQAKVTGLPEVKK